jgi:hypothetical protein
MTVVESIASRACRRMDSASVFSVTFLSPHPVKNIRSNRKVAMKATPQTTPQNMYPNGSCQAPCQCLVRNWSTSSEVGSAIAGIEEFTGVHSVASCVASEKFRISAW